MAPVAAECGVQEETSAGPASAADVDSDGWSRALGHNLGTLPASGGASDAISIGGGWLSYRGCMCVCVRVRERACECASDRASAHEGARPCFSSALFRSSSSSDMSRAAINVCPCIARAISHTHMHTSCTHACTDTRPHATSCGRTYYYNTHTKETTWTNPLSAMASTTSPPGNTVARSYCDDACERPPPPLSVYACMFVRV